MYTWVRTADIHDGQLLPAMEWALKVTSYVNDNFGMNAVVQRNVTGKQNQLHWVATHDSLASIEEVGAATFADEGFQQMMAESAELGLFIAQSVEDNIYQTIP